MVCTHEAFKDGQRVPHRILVACDARIEQEVERHATVLLSCWVVCRVVEYGEASTLTIAQA